jgi:hypothetical protein
MCVQEHNKEKHGEDRYEQVLSLFTIMWALWTVTENCCSGTAVLHVHVFLVKPCSMYMLFMRKLWKTKQNFNWISLNSFQRLFTLPDQSTSGDATTTLQTLWYAHERKAPCYTLQGLQIKWNRSEINWGCENVWKASMFSWELWKLSHIQNY